MKTQTRTAGLVGASSPGESDFRSAFDKMGRRVLVLPVELRDELKVPFGPVVQTGEVLGYIKDPSRVVCVGDVCSDALLSVGVVPQLSMVDLATRRGAYTGWSRSGRKETGSRPGPKPGAGAGWKVIRVKNPAATLQPETWQAIKQAYGSDRPVRVVVEGEEDLAALACILGAPPGYTVIYGMPNRGMVVVSPTKKTKQIVLDILERMNEENTQGA